MITIEQWMKICDYRITEGTDYLWNCFGNKAYSLDSWSGDNEEGHSLCIVFDRDSQTVYQVEAHDYKNERAYRYTNPIFRQAYEDQAKVHGGDTVYEYDMIDLDVEDDWVEKATAIVEGREYSTLISLPLELPDDQLLDLFKMAHAEDMTFNAFVIKILTDKMAEIESKKNTYCTDQ